MRKKLGQVIKNICNCSVDNMLISVILTFLIIIVLAINFRFKIFLDYSKSKSLFVLFLVIVFYLHINLFYLTRKAKVKKYKLWKYYMNIFFDLICDFLLMMAFSLSNKNYATLFFWFYLYAFAIRVMVYAFFLPVSDSFCRNYINKEINDFYTTFSKNKVDIDRVKDTVFNDKN